MEKNNILLPTYPKLKSKRLIDDFDKTMAEIDKAIGITKAKENDIRKRSVDENPNRSFSDIKTLAINKASKTQLRKKKGL